MSSPSEELIYSPGASLDAPQSRYPGFSPGRTILKAGTVIKEGALPLPQDLIFDRDVAVVTRDGITLYVDIYRPADVEGPLPAIVVWSPYGKFEGYMTFDDYPYRGGVPQRLLSGLDKFEGPDPARWCGRGYAVVNPDARGSYRSEGILAVWDRQEGEDGHDLVEWVAAQDWCSGKVGMAGTSWLAIGQWFTAAPRRDRSVGGNGRRLALHLLRRRDSRPDVHHMAVAGNSVGDRRRRHRRHARASSRA